MTASDGVRDDDAPGVRGVLDEKIVTVHVQCSVDLSVVDLVVPAPIRTSVAVLRSDDPLDVLANPKAMVVAERLVPAPQRGRAGTRWRDFADLLYSCPAT